VRGMVEGWEMLCGEKSKLRCGGVVKERARSARLKRGVDAGLMRCHGARLLPARSGCVIVQLRQKDGFGSGGEREERKERQQRLGLGYGRRLIESFVSRGCKDTGIASKWPIAEMFCWKFVS